MIRNAGKVLDRMVAAGLLKVNPVTEEYTITRNGIEELQYSKLERKGMINDAEQEMVIAK